MALVSAQELAATLAPGTRLLGLDLGSKTIGIAVSDGRLAVATAVETIRRRKFTHDLARLAEIITERNVGGLVLGLPLNMDGSEGPRCQSTRAFAANLLAQMDLPLALWDERLSSSAVERFLIDGADLSRRKRANVIDHMAASYILQGFLDRLATLPDRRIEGAP